MRLRQGVTLAAASSGYLLLDPRRGIYWHMNVETMRFLEALQSGTAIDDFVVEIAQRTGVSPEIVRVEHLQILHDLRKAKIITGTPA